MLYEYSCTIRSITDGDGLRVDIDLGFGVTLRGDSGRGVNIRLFGVDAPESRTRNKQEKAHGLLAKKFVEEHCQVGEKYILRTKEKGKFGRWLGEIKTRRDLLQNYLSKTNSPLPIMGRIKKKLKQLMKRIGRS